MFYATKIKSVVNGAAVDVNGKRLSFIGYLPVKPGDTVFTDGNVIFGNAPPKGSPAVFDNPSGIPVLADKGSDDKELRGYFSLNGRFKNYRIAGEHWIVNDKKLFKHDDDDAVIIDAEFSDDGKLYTVEKVDRKIADTDSDYRFVAVRNGVEVCSLDANYLIPLKYTRVNLEIPFNNAEFVKCDDTIIKNIELVIKKDGVTVNTLKLSQLCEQFEDEVKQRVTIVTVPDTDSKDDFKARAILQNFKIKADGSWEAIILYGIWMSRGFLCHVTTVAGGDAILHEEITEKKTPIEEHWRKVETRTELVILEMPRSGLNAADRGATTAFDVCLIKITSDDKVEKLAQQQKNYPLYFEPIFQEYVNSPPTVNSSPTDYPYIKYFDINTSFWVREYKNGRAWFPDYYGDDGTPYYCSYKSHIENIHTGAGQDFHYEYSAFPWWEVIASYIYDSRNMPNAPDYDNPVEEIADEFTFPVQDDYQARIMNIDEEIDQWQFGGVFDKDNKQIIEEILPDETDAHKWNMSCASLKGGQYLFGFHKDDDRDIVGKLYKISKDGDIEQVGKGLKNFRLRELKNINKAKR